MLTAELPPRPESLLLIGRTGCGRTILARRLIPTMHATASFLAGEVDRVLRSSGLQYGRPDDGVLVPFRAPHHTVSLGGMTGTFRKGWDWRPGELSLAHGGVLFLDEVEQFSRRVLDAVLEAHRTGSVALGGIRPPAHFRLIAAASPCPCGYYLRPEDGGMPAGRECRCTPAQVEAYAARLEPLRAACDRVMYEPEIRRVGRALTGAETRAGRGLTPRETAAILAADAADVADGGPGVVFPEHRA